MKWLCMSRLENIRIEVFNRTKFGIFIIKFSVWLVLEKQQKMKKTLLLGFQQSFCSFLKCYDVYEFVCIGTRTRYSSFQHFRQPFRSWDSHSLKLEILSKSRVSKVRECVVKSHARLNNVTQQCMWLSLI